jgi:hypothetical protein
MTRFCKCVRWVGAAILFSACRFRFDPLTDGATTTEDIETDTAPCAPINPVDAFDPAPSPCGTWGMATQVGMTIARVNGALEITPPTTAPAASEFGGCTVSPTDFVGDIVVEVSSALSGQGYTNSIFYIAAGYIGIGVDATDGMIFALVDPNLQMGKRPFDPVAMRFWRLHPIGTTAATAEVSPDARTWTVLGMRTLLDQPATVGMWTFGAGRNVDGATGIARFESLNQCP